MKHPHTDNIRSLISDAISALHEVEDWILENDVGEASEALTRTRETIDDIGEWFHPGATDSSGQNGGTDG